MKFAICSEIFKDWALEKAFGFVAQAGYDAIEIAPFTLAPYVTDVPAAKRAGLKELAAQNHIAISGIHWVLAGADGMHLTDPDAAVRERTSRYFCHLVDFCADLGGKTVVVGSPKQRSLRPGISFEQGWEWATAVFRSAVMQAEKRAVTICFEPLAPTETNFINTAARAIEFVRQLNTPHFRIILDVKAMCSEAKPIPEIIRDSWPYFAYFHANDKNLKGPGFGEVDFGPIAAALKETGYQGYVSVEVFDFEEGPERIALGSLETLKRAFR